MDARRIDELSADLLSKKVQEAIFPMMSVRRDYARDPKAMWSLLDAMSHFLFTFGADFDGMGWAAHFKHDGAGGVKGFATGPTLMDATARAAMQMVNGSFNRFTDIVKGNL